MLPGGAGQDRRWRGGRLREGIPFRLGGRRLREGRRRQGGRLGDGRRQEGLRGDRGQGGRRLPGPGQPQGGGRGELPIGGVGHHHHRLRQVLLKQERSSR